MLAACCAQERPALLPSVGSRPLLHRRLPPATVAAAAAGTTTTTAKTTCPPPVAASHTATFWPAAIYIELLRSLTEEPHRSPGAVECWPSVNCCQRCSSCLVSPHSFSIGRPIDRSIDCQRAAATAAKSLAPPALASGRRAQTIAAASPLLAAPLAVGGQGGDYNGGRLAVAERPQTSRRTVAKRWPSARSATDRRLSNQVQCITNADAVWQSSSSLNSLSPAARRFSPPLDWRRRRQARLNQA